MRQYVLQNIPKLEPMYSAGCPKMREYFLQNIPKVEQMYSAICPKDKTVCSSEYPEGRAYVFCRMS